jgi:hypothetical protein
MGSVETANREKGSGSRLAFGVTFCFLYRKAVTGLSPGVEALRTPGCRQQKSRGSEGAKDS